MAASKFEGLGAAQVVDSAPGGQADLSGFDIGLQVVAE